MEPESRAVNYRALPLETQVAIYDLFLSGFLMPTFVSQLTSVLSLSVGLAGCVFESEETGVAVIAEAAQRLAAQLLEHGRLMSPQELMLKRDAWERRS